MDEFKKKLQRRLFLLTGGLICSCALLFLSRYYTKETTVSDHLQGFFEGFQTGVVVALISFLGFFVVRFILAINNPDRMKKLYISETDERKLLIQQKSSTIGMNIVMFGLLLGTAVAGNINDTVFISLLCACLFAALVRGFLKLYYRNKY